MGGRFEASTTARGDGVLPDARRLPPVATAGPARGHPKGEGPPHRASSISTTVREPARGQRVAPHTPRTRARVGVPKKVRHGCVMRHGEQDHGPSLFLRAPSVFRRPNMKGAT